MSVSEVSGDPYPLKERKFRIKGMLIACVVLMHVLLFQVYKTRQIQYPMAVEAIGDAIGEERQADGVVTVSGVGVDVTIKEATTHNQSPAKETATATKDWRTTETRQIKRFEQLNQKRNRELTKQNTSIQKVAVDHDDHFEKTLGTAMLSEKYSQIRETLMKLMYATRRRTKGKRPKEKSPSSSSEKFTTYLIDHHASSNPVNFNSNSKEDVTLVTQLDIFKLTNMRVQINAWAPGPVVAVIFLETKQDISTLAKFVQDNAHTLRNTVLMTAIEAVRRKYYPVNALRNLAMELVKTDYFLALDVDFIPSAQAYKRIKNLLRKNKTFKQKLKQNKTMFVLPAFDLVLPPGKTKADLDMIPKSTAELMEMLKQNKTEIFHASVYSQGHGPTNYEKWIKIQNERLTTVRTRHVHNNQLYHYPVQFVDGFEPYVLGYRPNVPLYWPLFRGYAFNKVAWFMELNAAGYQFETLTDFYVIHLRHPVLNKYDKFIDMRWNYPHFASYLLYLKEKYNRTYYSWVPSERDMRKAEAEAQTQAQALREKALTSDTDVSEKVIAQAGQLSSKFDPTKSIPVTCWTKDIQGLRPYLLNVWSELKHNAEIEPERQRILPHLICRQSPVLQNDVVLATHLDVFRLKMMLTQVKEWGGPSSTAIWITSQNQIESFVSFLDTHPQILLYATFHLVLEKTQEPYPHNMLRNLALEYCESDYFVALDVDFIPSPNSHTGLFNLIQSGSGDIKLKLRKEKTVFVLPAFDLWAKKGQTHASTDMLPRSAAQVAEMVDEGRMGGFDMDHFIQGHGPTNFTKWFSIHKNRDDQENLKLSRQGYYPIKYAERFEPYILGYRPWIPRYWSWFRGYGYNKYSWFMELDAAGYKFATLINFFLSHLEHPEKDQLSRSLDMQENYKYVLTFNEHLRHKYNRTYNFWVPSQEMIEEEKMRLQKEMSEQIRRRKPRKPDH